MPTARLARGKIKPALGPRPDGLQAPERANHDRWTDEEEASGPRPPTCSTAALAASRRASATTRTGQGATATGPLPRP